ncbi:hypothetical protein F4803DRAFT_55938 [Xylaria telfairii]|nr:hypothetical protein F4803DRAFT_55938 [Xylaria telfairii]
MSVNTVPPPIVNWAETYCVSLSTTFGGQTGPTEETLNELTDNWIKEIAPELDFPWDAVTVSMFCASCLNEDWISSRFGRIFWTLGFDEESSKLKLFRYLLWRFGQHIGGSIEDQMVSDTTTEDVELDYGSDSLDYMDDE